MAAVWALAGAGGAAEGTAFGAILGFAFEAMAGVFEEGVGAVLEVLEHLWCLIKPAGAEQFPHRWVCAVVDHALYLKVAPSGCFSGSEQLAVSSEEEDELRL